MPNGEKIIKVELTRPKMFMRVDLLMMISTFFNTMWPKYPTDREAFDRPNYYSNDPGNASRQELIFEMKEGLICFENSTDS